MTVVWPIVTVATTTVVCVFFSAWLDLADMAMLYLLAIMFVALRVGRIASMLASLLSVAAFNFWSIPPRFTFAVAHPHYFITFAMMFGVGIVISTLTHRLRRQEREANESALRARTEELRSSLLSSVSHDLRTPLAAIAGSASTLASMGDKLTRAQTTEMLETIQEEAQRMERLVANLLDMTRIDAGRAQLRREWVPLEEIVGAVTHRIDGRASGHHLHVELPPSLPLISVDPVLFEQVLANLIENALKYTPRGTTVSVTAVNETGFVAIDVADQGAGIPRGDELRVFDKFYRGQHTGTRGAGLGLAICKAIVEAHGGTIRASNRAEGGALFRTQLPLGGASPPSAWAEMSA